MTINIKITSNKKSWIKFNFFWILF